MRIVGIDPGLEGAIACLDDNAPSVSDMPTRQFEKETWIDFRLVVQRLDIFMPELIVIERLQGQPTFGSRNFKLGCSYGAVLNAAEYLAVPLLLVKPQTWKKALLEGTDKSKEAAVGFIQNLYPNLDLFPSGIRKGKPKPSHDRAEAVCLALYGRKFHE